jgi:small subunit ribosomal protein S6
MRKYELMLIVPPDADDAAVQAVTDRITQTLAEQGGEIVKVDRWGRRRLAYPIDRHTDGYYVVVELQAEPEAVKELDRVLALLDEVIRFKVVVRSAA